MTDHTHQFDVGHPAPGRDRVAPWRIALTLALGPLAWGLQLALGSGLSGAACVSGSGEVLAFPEWSWAMPVTVGGNLLALALCVLAFIVSVINLRATQHEREHASGGVMDAGEGRTRFLAVWGLWISMLFLLAVGFNTVFFFWGSLCGP